MEANICEPISLAVASFAMTAAGAFTSHQAASEAADEQNRQAAEARKAAVRNFEENQSASNTRLSQEADAAAAEKFDIALEARKARSTAEVAGGESGASGLSLDNMLKEFSTREARYTDRIDQQQDWTATQIAAEKRGAGYAAVDKINSIQTAKKPGFLDLGLKIGAAAVNSAASYKNMTSKSVSTRY